MQFTSKPRALDKLTGIIALKQIKRLKQREIDYYEDREAERRLATAQRSFTWQSYCVHGTYIGDPYGADYLCFKCEDGIGIYEEAVANAQQIKRIFDSRVSAIIQTSAAFGATASAVMDQLFDIALDQAGLTRKDVGR